MKTLFTTLIIFFISLQSQAFKIITVKGGKALIDLEGETARVGEQFFAVGPDGKRKAALTINQVKGQKAIAKIDKGQAREGFSLEPREQKSNVRASKDKSAWGLSAGYAMNKMTVKPTGGTVDLSGSSFSVLGFYQTDLDKNFSVKLSGGYQSLVANGTSATALCTGSTNCNVNIGYLGLNALVRYTLVQNRTLSFWGGAGLGFLFAVSKSSNILDTTKITTNQTINGALGVDYHLSKKEFIPLQFEYAMFPDNSSSSASQMILSAGYGWDF